MKNLTAVILMSLMLLSCSNTRTNAQENNYSKTQQYTLTAQQIIDAIDSGDPSVYAKLLTDDSRFRFGNYPMVKGKEAIFKAQTDFFSSVKNTKHQILRTWKNENSMVVDLLVTYIRHDGSTITLPVVDIFEIVDNKVDATIIYMDINPLYATQ